jgi:hypothetical protein
VLNVRTRTLAMAATLRTGPGLTVVLPIYLGFCTFTG